MMQTKWGKCMSFYKTILTNLICFPIALSPKQQKIFPTAPSSVMTNKGANNLVCLNKVQIFPMNLMFFRLTLCKKGLI